MKIKTILSWKFTAYTLLILVIVLFLISLYLIETNKSLFNKINSVQQDADSFKKAYNTFREAYEQSDTSRYTTEVKLGQLESNKSCSDTDIFITTQDGLFSAILSDGKYHICRNYTDTDNKSKSILINSEVGRIKVKNNIYVAFTDQRSEGDRIYSEPKVFKVDNKANTLTVVLDQKSIPINDGSNPNNPTRNSNQEVYYLLWNEDSSIEWSPDGRLMLLWVFIGCYQCENDRLLYALDTRTDNLVYIGIPYTSNGNKYNIDWVNNNTVRWEETSIHQATQQELNEQEANSGYAYPIVKKNLGYRTKEF